MIMLDIISDLYHCMTALKWYTETSQIITVTSQVHSSHTTGAVLANTQLLSVSRTHIQTKLPILTKLLTLLFKIHSTKLNSSAAAMDFSTTVSYK